MARRTRSTLLGRSLQRSLRAITRSAVRAGAKAMVQALQPRPAKPAKKSSPTRSRFATGVRSSTGITVGIAGAQRYRLFVPPGVQRTERLPLLVMLHGCGQNAEALAASTRMNQLALRARFVVLYPEQNTLANLHGCWNWHQTRTGQAQREADAVNATISQVCQLTTVDATRIALVGLSAGASMAALLATRHPERFRAIAMHSGIAPGMAHSSASALKAMQGRGLVAPLSPLSACTHLPALLVIQGSADRLVAPSNGNTAVQLWATREAAKAGLPRTVQRGARYPATVTDYKTKGRLVATLCDIKGLGHAWSGGAANQAYSDPKGPDASRMIWSFAVKQFAKLVA